MTAQEFENYAINKMNEHGLLDEGYYFKWTTSRRVLGMCRYGSKQICVSKYHFDTDYLSDVKDTLMHEIAHALTPGHDHDTTWREMARKLGAHPRATKSCRVKKTAKNKSGHRWAITYEGEVIRRYYRKPSLNVNSTYITNKPESMGKLKLIKL